MRSHVVCLAVLAAFMSACGGDGDSTRAIPQQTGTKRIDAASTGAIAGRVTYQGQTPVPATIRITGDPACRAHSDTVQDETLLVDGAGGIKNAFVYVKNGLEDYAFDPPTEPAVLDNKGCRYEPHVLGVRVGQPLRIRNSDATMHNVHGMAHANQEFNQSLPLQGMTITETFTAPEIGIPFKCNVHGWMTAYGHVVAHPYFAVTDAAGRFSLPNLPPGTYILEVWHEKLGSRTQQITLAPKQSAEATFTYTS